MSARYHVIWGTEIVETGTLYNEVPATFSTTNTRPLVATGYISLITFRKSGIRRSFVKDISDTSPTVERKCWAAMVSGHGPTVRRTNGIRLAPLNSPAARGGVPRARTARLPTATSSVPAAQHAKHCSGGRESWWERERGREGNKIWNSGYKVWNRDNMGVEEMDIE